MEPPFTGHDDIGHDEPSVHNWRVFQLKRLGIPASLAEIYADRIDWPSNLDFPRRWNWPWCWRNWSCGHLRCRATPAPPRLMTSNTARTGDGFARDFATADGERVMVAAITRQQFADLAKAARLARTFAFLERLLYADFSACSDLYTHRETIAALLAPWFSRRTVADLAAAFAGTSVPWACLHNRPGGLEQGRASGGVRPGPFGGK